MNTEDTLKKRIQSGRLRREDVARRLAEIAFGKANDCVKLVLEEDLSKSQRERYVEFFNNNAEVLNTQGTTKTYLYNGHWASPGDRYGNDLGAQVIGCTMIEAKAYYEKVLKAQRDKAKN